MTSRFPNRRQAVAPVDALNAPRRPIGKAELKLDAHAVGSKPQDGLHDIAERRNR
jgi:hypothetical protein